MVRLCALLGLSLCLAACGGDDEGEIGPDSGVDELDPSEAVYDRGRLLDIEIELDAADWDVLRKQARGLFDVIGSSCLSDPPQKPFTYFEATVRIDGEEIAQVGVRKKGFFGSLDEIRPSLKLKFSEYLPEQRYFGLQRLTLNNNKSDPSHIKQCIGYDVFTKAGVPAPRCNLARVTVNGQYLGIYSNVEGIKKRFIGRHFEDNEGNLYEGALSDFRPGWINTFQKKTNKSEDDRSDIEALVPVATTGGDEFLDVFAEHVDMREFYAFWVSERLIAHADGYGRNTNNFYIYRDPADGRFSFIPWGIDSILVDFATLPWEDQVPPDLVWAEGAFSRRLFEYSAGRDDYYLELRRQLDEVWDEDELVASIDQMESLITPHLQRPADEVAAAIEGVRGFVRGQRAKMEQAMAEPTPVLEDELREPWCIEVVGDIQASFSANWGTMDSQNPLDEGDAPLFDLSMDGQTFVFDDVGAVAGLNDDGLPAVNLVGIYNTNELIAVSLATNEENFVSGNTFTLDSRPSLGVVVHILLPMVPGGMPELSFIGMVGEGDVTLTQASMQDGGDIAGSVDSPVYESIF